MFKSLWTMASVALLAGGAWGAHTGTVEIAATNVVDGVARSVTLAFANHANETNGLWVVYGREDAGETTNGWDVVRFLATVPPEMDSYDYTLPLGWGGEMAHAIRFILSEVPYLVDCTLTDLRSDKASKNAAQAVILDGFTLNGSDRVYVRASFDTINPGRAQGVFCARPANGDSTKTPYFNVFLLDGGKFRLDYNNKMTTETTVRAAKQVYEIEASQAGLFVNGTQAVETSATAFSDAACGTPYLFVGKTTALSSQAKMWLLSFKVYSSAGALRLDLVPVLKDGVPALYDTVKGTFYYSYLKTSGFQELTAGTRIESANPFFASAAYEVEVAAGPTVFVTPEPRTLSAAYVNSDGGILLGTSVLTLTGANDFGGRFVVSNGTLVADFGQGLAATDNLVLAGGAYGGWNGQVTQSLGAGGGEISFASGLAGGFSAVTGDLTVNIGGAGAPFVLDASAPPGTLLLNDANATGTLTFQNPVTLVGTVNVRNDGAPAVFAEAVIGDRGEHGGTLYVYGDYTSGGQLVFAKGISGKTYYQKGGNVVFPAGTTNVFGGNFYVEGGTFLLTNAVVRMVDEAVLANGFRIYRGPARVVGSVVECRELRVGQDGDQPGSNQGTLFLSGSTLTVKGAATIFRGSGSAALQLENGSQVSVSGDINFAQRNIYVNNGKLTVTGGILCNGKAGTARCTVASGGVLEVKHVSRTNVTPETGHNGEFVFNGGLVRQTKDYGTFFNNMTKLYVVGSKGGVFESDFDTMFTSPLVTSDSSLGYSNMWNYQPSAYLTAPALIKRGAGTLTIMGTNTFACALAVEGGTLALAPDTKLPSGTVLRLGSGNFDLGGQAQTVRAIVSTGTVGAVSNGSLTVTEGVYPGGAGTVGTLNVDATLAGTLVCDVRADGTCDALQATGTLDLSNLDLTLGDGAAFSAAQNAKSLPIVVGATTGAFRSQPALPSGWAVSVRSAGVFLARSGLLLVIR